MDLKNNKTIEEIHSKEINSSSMINKFQFTCTLDQLQDLVTKLKDATKQLERSAL